MGVEPKVILQQIDLNVKPRQNPLTGLFYTCRAAGSQAKPLFDVVDYCGQYTKPLRLWQVSFDTRHFVISCDSIVKPHRSSFEEIFTMLTKTN